jgi:hypothetical protein
MESGWLHHSASNPGLADLVTSSISATDEFPNSGTPGGRDVAFFSLLHKPLVQQLKDSPCGNG